MSEMMNEGTDLQAINDATEQNRIAAKNAATQKGIHRKKTNRSHLAVSCLMAADSLGGIVGLCYMEAMVDWLGSIAACAVTFRVGIAVGKAVCHD